jgi:hypothetical protein
MSDQHESTSTPFSQQVKQYSDMAQSLMGRTSVVHREWFFQAVKTMQLMDEELRAQNRSEDPMSEYPPIKLVREMRKADT